MRVFPVVLLLFLFFNSCKDSTKLKDEQQPKMAYTVNYDSLKNVLETVYDTDQSVRQELRTLIDSLGRESSEVGKCLGKMMANDSLNQVQLKDILGKYGWLPKSKVGDKAASAIYLVIQHSEIETMEKYLPQFQQMAEKGEANKVSLAKMEDRLLMWSDKKQRYGTQATSVLREDGTMAVWPIEDPANVNARRKAVGFTSTVEENAKRLKADYNPKEPLPVKE